MAQPLQSNFPQVPALEVVPTFHGNLKRKLKHEDVLAETERNSRAQLWRSKHSEGFPLRCGDAWHPILLSISERWFGLLPGGYTAPGEARAA